jgi:hypothetical protein
VQDAGSADAGPGVQVDPVARAILSVREPQQVCLLDAQAALACRGPNDALHVVQTGPFIDYAMNVRGDGCGLSAEGALRCWGGASGNGALARPATPIVRTRVCPRQTKAFSRWPWARSTLVA